MAYFQINNNKYGTYYRSRFYLLKGSVNLETLDKDEALERHDEVCRVEKTLKRIDSLDRILDYEWYWLEENNKLEESHKFNGISYRWAFGNYGGEVINYILNFTIILF